MVQAPFSIVRWTFANFLGWLLGIALVLTLSSSFDSIGVENLQFYTSLGMGAGVGLMQWRYLKKSLGMSRRWLWFSILGLGIPFLLLDGLRWAQLIDLGDQYLLVGVLISSVTAGVLQSGLLKPYTSRSRLWAPICLVAWLAALGSVWLMDDVLKADWPLLLRFFANLFLMLSGGVLLGGISGMGLWYLIKSGDFHSDTQHEN